MELPDLEVVHEAYPLTEDFRRDWEQLHARALGANIFLALEWIEAGWLSFAPEGDIPRPLRFRNAQGETVAMAFHKEVLSRRRGVTLRAWRTVDYNSQRIAPLLAPDFAHLAAALLALYRSEGRRVDVFEFFKLDPLGCDLLRLRGELGRHGLKPELRRFNEQPRLVLPDTWEEYRHSHKKTFWKSRRRWRNRMGREIGDVRFARLRGPADFGNGGLERALAETERLFERTWQYEAVREAGVITPEQYWDFYARIVTGLAPRGMLDVALLYAGDRLVACGIELVEDGAIHMLYGGYDAELKRYGPGGILMVEELEDGHARGDRIYEYGGEYVTYKQQWTNDTVNACRLRFPGATPLARARKLLNRRPVITPKSGGRLAAGLVRRLERSPVPPAILDYGSFHVFEVPLLEADPPEARGLRGAVVTPDQLPALAECRGMADPEAGAREMATRFDLDSLCVGLWDGERCVGYAWCIRGTNVLEDRDRYRMRLGPRGGYIYDTFLHPDVRGRGLYAVLLKRLQSAVGEQGVGRFYLTVDIFNPRSLRAHAKLGVGLIETISYVCVLGLRVHTSRSDLGIRRGFSFRKPRKEFLSPVLRYEEPDTVEEDPDSEP